MRDLRCAHPHNGVRVPLRFHARPRRDAVLLGVGVVLTVAGCALGAWLAFVG